MSSRRDFAELIELLVSQKKSYALLLSLSNGQQRVFEDSGATGLMKVIARKQVAINDLRALDVRLSRYTENWQDTMNALPGEARREVAALVTDISALVKRLVESERSIEAVVSKARDDTGARMRGVTEGLNATRAYGSPPLAGAGRLLDREG